MCTIHVAISSICLLKLHQRLLLKTPQKLAIYLLSQVKTKQFSHKLENLKHIYIYIYSSRIMISCLGLGFIVGVGLGC